MIASLAQGLVGVIVDEVAMQGGRRLQQQQQQQREGDAPHLHQQQHQQLYSHPQGQQQQHQQQLPPGPLASLVESITTVFNRTLAAIVTGLQYLLLLEALLLSAVVIYGALYWLAMPLRLHDRPIYFDYSDRATKGGATGTVDFLAQHTQWHPSPLTKVERVDAKVLQPGQHYKVGLELQMPTSYTNRRVGVFMVHTTLLDHEDNELASSARPAMLPHTSALRKGVGMLFSWPLHVAGLKQEAETVYVDCIDFYEENALHPLTKARVHVSSGRVQFYRSSINITPELKGLPWLMRDWFYSTLAAGVLFIASLELMVFGFCYVFFFLGLEDPAKSKSKDSIRATTRKNRNTAAAVPREGGGGGGGGGDDEHLPAEVDIGGAVTEAAAATGAAGGEGRGLRGEEGLRRRTGSAPAAPASAAADRAGNRAGVDASFRPTPHRAERKEAPSASWVGGLLPAPSSSYSPDLRQRPAATAAALPPGVQAYQRGARYVVQASRPEEANAGTSGGTVSGGGTSNDGGVGGGGSSDGGGGVYGRTRSSNIAGGGGSRGAQSPRLVPENASEEELDAAALASWAALDVGDGSLPARARRAGGGVEGVDFGGRRAIARQGRPGVVVTGEDAGSVGRSQEGRGRGEGSVEAAGSRHNNGGSASAAVVAAGFGESGGTTGFVGTREGRVADSSGSSVDGGDQDMW